MQIRYGNFSKRTNSTLIPADATLTLTADAEVTEDCSVIYPVLKLGYTAWQAGYNYVYIPSWGMYYFVSDAKVTPGRVWYVSLACDFAASYRAQIMQTYAYVVYANARNSEIIDTRIPIKTTKSVLATIGSLTFLNTQGYYMLSVIGSSGNAAGTNGAQTYGLTRGALGNVLSAAAAEVQSWAAQDTTEAILTIGRQAAGIGSIGECIQGCTWIPWDVQAMGLVTLEDIYLGLFRTTYAGWRVDSPIKKWEVSVAIPWQHSDWRRNSPYTQVYLYLPFVGVTQLSSENLIGQTHVDVHIAVNILTGNLDYEIKSGDQVIATYSAASGLGIPVGAGGITGETAAIGQIYHAGSLFVKGAAAIAGVVASASVGPIAGAAIAGTNALISGGLGAMADLSNIAPNTISSGNLSGGASVALDQNVICFTVCHDTVIQPSAMGPVLGEPYNAPATVGDLTGYVQCSGASVQGAMPDIARDTINRMLNGGIFIE